MKKIVVFLIALICSSAAYATTVTATVVDSGGQTWTNGTFTATLVANSTTGTNFQYAANGTVFTQTVYTGAMNSSGVLTVVIPGNDIITPSGTTWTFQLCPNATSGCQNVPVYISGSTIDISASITVGLSPLKIPTTALPTAYTDNEVIPSVGAIYLNTTSQLPRYYNGSWNAISGSGSGTVTTVSGSTSGGFVVNTTNPTTTPAISVAVDGTHFLPVNTGLATLYLNQAGAYSTPAGAANYYTSGTFTGISTSTITPTHTLDVQNSAAPTTATTFNVGLPASVSNTGGTNMVVNCSGSQSGFAFDIVNAQFSSNQITGDCNGNIGAAGIVKTAQGLTLGESTAITGASGFSQMWADSTAHRLAFNYNNAGVTYNVGTAQANTASSMVKFGANGYDILTAVAGTDYVAPSALASYALLSGASFTGAVSNTNAFTGSSFTKTGLPSGCTQFPCSSGTASQVAQTASITTTTIFTPTVNTSSYTFNITLRTTTAGTAGTVTATIACGVYNATTTSLPLTATGVVGTGYRGTWNTGDGACTYSTTVTGATGSPQYQVDAWVDREK